MTNHDLRQLRYFVAVVEEGHFGRAAERLGIKQPPLSRQVKALEESLGCRLLRRRPRVEPTEAGRVLWTEARRLLGHWESALEATRLAGRGERGTVAIGLTSSMMLTAVADLIPRLRERHPGVVLNLSEVPSALQSEALYSRSIDVGFQREPSPLEGLVFEPVVREPFLVALPASHRMTERARLRLASLAGEPFVLFPRRVAPRLSDRVIGMCQSAGFAPDVVQETGDWITILGLVSAGLGVTLVPESIGRLQWPRVQYRPLSPRGVTTEIAMGFREESLRPPVTQFVHLVRAELGGR